MKIKYKIQNMVNILTCGLYSRVKNSSKLFINDVLDDDSGDKLKKYAFLLIMTIFLLFSINIVGTVLGLGGELGSFGDFIGGVANPILTFLTFICLIKTIFMQRDELVLSRKELELTRKEYIETQLVIRRQSVESTFYNGLNLHHEIARNLQVDFNDSVNLISAKAKSGLALNIKNGRQCFKALLDCLVYDDPTQDELIEKYKYINKNRNEWFGHYFRNLYRIIKIIDDLPGEYFSVSQKKEYCHTLRAQLSSDELAVLMLNCYGDVCDRGEFRGLLSRYQMLEHLPLRYTEKDDRDEVKVEVAGSFIVTLSFLSTFILSNEEVEKAKNRIDLKRHPGGAFGKNLSIAFPKRLRDVNNYSDV
ncbi:TPA: putative phage abortive infection protein [Klebsiella pneumoniae]|nr:putative phage abortive infection protein [Klebsiella pneumoniae]HCF8553997.1 putative phage abortive infection protein [Klebsiella pneumoniae]HCF8990271.1 putative phage abortive infection protein [Klebsiella pneumoniae]